MSSPFYVRMSVADRPGVLARVARIFADEELSILSVVQSGSGDEASLVLILHAGPEDRVQRRGGPRRGARRRLRRAGDAAGAGLGRGGGR